MDNENIEERLYSLAHHDTKNDSAQEIEVPNYNPTRVVSSKTVINHPDYTRQSSKRYWINNEKHGTFKGPKFNPISQNPLTEKIDSSSAVSTPPKFVPYSSILSGLNVDLGNLQDAGKSKQKQKKSPNFEKNKKNQKTKFPKTKLLNPLSKGGLIKLQSLHKVKVEQQHQKGNAAKKTQNQQNAILIESSSENDDEVIAIEGPPPPTINLDSSDESVVSKKEFTLPKSVRQLKSTGMMDSPRPISPSSNSMMSDDFIVAPDKTRLLIDNYSEPGLQTAESPKNLQGESSKSNNSANKTLEDFKSQMTKPSSTESSSGQNTDRSSCEKEKGLEKKQEDSAKILRKLSKEQDSNEDSVYGSKAKKRVDSGTRKRSVSTKPSEESSSDEENKTIVPKKPKIRRRKSLGGRSSGKNTGDSESGTEIEPKHKLFASTPKEAKKKPKSRQKFNSERYEDDDFNTLLSTIVQDNDENDDMEDSEESDANVDHSVKEIRDSESFVTIDEVGDSDGEKSIPEIKNPVVSVIEIEDSNISPTKLSISVDDSDVADCTIIEKPIETITVDDESPYISSTGEKIIIPRPWKQQIPDDCDLMLNIRRSKFEPHEYIRDYDPNKPKKKTTPEDIAQELSRSDAGWNDEMKIFYNESWGGEAFNLTQVLANMPRDRNVWKIDRPDFYRPQTDMRIKCHNCNEYGHMKAKCKRPRKRIVCIMCGEEGHRETRCHNTICLLCGKPNKIFSQGCVNCVKFQKKICPLCQTKGHDISLCPDKWRRYHSTTTESMNLNSEVTYNKDRIYCCICAKKGHWAEQCKSSEKVVTGSLLPGTYEIKSHKPIYPVKLNFEEGALENQQVFSMFSYFENYEFDFESLKNPGGYYSRIEALNKRKEEMLEEAKQKKESKAAKKRKRRNEKSGDKKFRMQENFTFENSPQQEMQGNPTDKMRSFNFSEEIKKIEDSSFALSFLKPTEHQNVSTDETLKITLNTRNSGRLVNVEGRDSPYNFTEYFEDPNSVSVGKFVKNPDTSRIAYEIQDGPTTSSKSQENTRKSPEHLDTSDILPYPGHIRKSPITVGPGQHENFRNSSPVCASQDFEKLEVVVSNSAISGRFVKHQESGNGGGHKLKEDLAKRLEPARPQSKIDNSGRGKESFDKSADVSLNVTQIPITEFNTTPGITPGPSQPNSDDESAIDKRDLFSRKVLPDYISLEAYAEETKKDDSRVDDSREYAEEEISDSRVLLKKSHLKILFNAVGRKFIEEVEKKYEVNLEFGSDDNGDHLTVSGYLSNQQLFQQELKDFLYKIESQEFEKHQIMSTQVPKERGKLISLIEQQLKVLNKRQGNPEKLYDEMMNAEKDFDYKKVIKTRRLLNLVLLGQKGMGDGKSHLNALKVILAALQSDTSADKQIEKEMRDTISEHMLYIFSSRKHNYQDLMEEYISKKKPKMLPNPASMVRDQNNKMVPIPSAPPPPPYYINSANYNTKSTQAPPPKWYPQATPQNISKAKRLMDMVKSSRAMLSNIHHSYETDSVFGMLQDYQEKIQLGQMSKGISKKLKRIHKVLQEKVQEVRNN